MLKGIPPIVGPDLLWVLQSMGHGDTITIVDANYPGESAGPELVRMDGHSAAERIKQAAPGVGMIMVTNLPTLDNVQKALQIGISGFVVKPFNAVKVVEAIANCMKQKR